MDDLPAELLLEPRRIVEVGGDAPPVMTRIAPRCWVGLTTLAGRPPRRQRMASSTAGAQAVRVTPSAGDAAQDLGPVDLSLHHLPGAHRGKRRRADPTRCSEKGVGSAGRRHARRNTHVPAEADGVKPERTVGELHTLRAGGRARCVVDRRGDVLVGLPVPGRLDVGGGRKALRRARAVHHDRLRPRRCPRRPAAISGSSRTTFAPEWLDDVDRISSVFSRKLTGHDRTASVCAHPEQGDHETGAVRADDRDPLAVVHAQAVELAGHPARPSHEVGVRVTRPSDAGPPGLVHHRGSGRRSSSAAVEEVDQGQGDPHAGQRSALRPARPDPRPAR